jgi:hypothetical protein
MFAVETIIPELFEKNYNFSSWEIGNLVNLIQLPISLLTLTVGLSYIGCGKFFEN